jgi:PPM family protein phosphatase
MLRIMLIWCYKAAPKSSRPGWALRVEYAELSLVGHREDNQDRVSVAVGEHSVLLLVVDGMGGHAEGARAAETALKSMLECFWHTPHPIFDPLGFLHLTLGKAHEDVVALGGSLSMETRPRATCAVCLVQLGASYWGHVGDSRVYQIRSGQVCSRTRDHSHVEQVLRDGVITEDEVVGHPMRNFVECCLGGDAALPDMTISRRKPLAQEDVLLLCTDGVWANLRDNDIGAFYPPDNGDLRVALQALGARAVQASAPYSDNTTAAAMRWLGQ